MVLCAYSRGNIAVNWGGLKLSVTLDDQYTVDASDLHNGNYSVVVPRQWSQRVGKHTLTFNAAEMPILFCPPGSNFCGSPLINPIPLHVLPLTCASSSHTRPDSTGYHCICDPGTSRMSNDECRPCADGKYDSSFGTFSCFSTDFQRSLVVKPVEGLQCIPCPECMKCFNGQPHLKAGWSVTGTTINLSELSLSVNRGDLNELESATARSVYRCPYPDVCPAGALQELGKCRNGTHGKFCGACALSFFRSRRTNTCKPCGQDGTSSAITWFVIGGAALAAALALRTGAADLCDQAGIKIVLGYLQVMTQLGSVLDLDYGALMPSFAATLESLGSLFFGVSDLFRRVHCTLDFYQLFFADVLGVPLSLLLLIWLKYWLYDRKRYGLEEALHLRRISAFFMAFMLYPSISHKIFRIFVCRKLGPDDVGWLEADYSVDCGSDKYRLLHTAALMLVLAIPIGLPALFASLLYRRRLKLLEFESLNMGKICEPLLELAMGKPCRRVARALRGSGCSRKRRALLLDRHLRRTATHLCARRTGLATVAIEHRAVAARRFRRYDARPGRGQGLQGLCQSHQEDGDASRAVVCTRVYLAGLVPV